jgi:hypothetical protein
MHQWRWCHFTAVVCEHADDAVLRFVDGITRRGIVKYLLTSDGINNRSIHDALLKLLNKPRQTLSSFPPPPAPFPAVRPWPGV